MNEEIQLKIPMVALRGLTVLPGMIVHFDIQRDKSIAAVEAAMIENEKIFLATQINPDVKEPKKYDLYQNGTFCNIKQLVKTPQGMVRVMVEGIYKASIIEIYDEDIMLKADFVKVDDTNQTLDEMTKDAMVRIIKDAVKEYSTINLKFAKEYLQSILTTDKLDRIIMKVSSDMPWEYMIRQSLLDSDNDEERYGILINELIKENQVSKIKKEFQAQLKENIDQNQKEYILREQLKIIQQELGDSNPRSDAEEYQKKLSSIKADKEVKDKIKKEIQRLKSMPGGGQESNVIRTYLDTVFEIPWKKNSKDNNDIKYAAAILDEDHYGLIKVKERIVEYLAVRILNPDSKGPILCLVGPPGTGKTSIAKSVARALNKKYVRISLGGIRDEAEIRGHRKTYVGAMPGRIADALIHAGVSNPLMLLDEIDKTSGDYRGDTSSALLEVLDGEQNSRFVDHYVELPIDLSQILFIATANTVETIPGPLRDRMEIIEVSSYTENEKFHIAKDYLIRKQMLANGIKEGQVDLSDAALKKIIHNYTREAGVRNLERRIGDIYRKTARQILEGKNSKIRISEKQLEKYLGKEKISFEEANITDEIGIVRGLAWTSAGGVTLQIEVNIMPGKGTLVLTGQLGGVMKESAQTALSCIRALTIKYNIEEDFFEKHDIHIHIPEGAVPKDGPSAGITMATAMLSAVTGIKIKASVAMTGEITLRGRVLPIGGLKEKILAAKMAHLKTVLVPAKNKPDIEELSKEITGGLKIEFVSNIEEVIDIAFVK